MAWELTVWRHCADDEMLIVIVVNLGWELAMLSEGGLVAIAIVSGALQLMTPLLGHASWPDRQV